MVFNRPDSPTDSHDESKAKTIFTPPETVTSDFDHKSRLSHIIDPSPYPVPWPGSTYMIRCTSTGEVITLLDGQITLTCSNDRGSASWECVENNGWLGFRNPVSGKYLGYDKKHALCRVANRQQQWEQFCAMVRPKGGCVLLMSHWAKLWPVATRKCQGENRLAKVEGDVSSGIAWEFIEIPFFNERDVPSLCRQKLD